MGFGTNFSYRHMDTRAPLLHTTTTLSGGVEPWHGIVGPLRLSLAGAESCISSWSKILDQTPSSLFAAPLEKSAFAYIDACRSLATQRPLVDVVRALIGSDDIMLASMSLLRKSPGIEHRWHSDIENVIDMRRCVDVGYTVWLPVEHAGPESTLLIIAGTHATNATAQSVHADALGPQCKVCPSRAKDSLLERGRSLTRLARSHHGAPGASLWRLHAEDGLAWIFRGATWHASINYANATRTALQMHFMPSRCAFRAHDHRTLNAPIAAQLDDVLPPVLPLLGAASPSVSGRCAAADDPLGDDCALRNNWYLPESPEPVAVAAPFDATPRRLKGARTTNLSAAVLRAPPPAARAFNFSSAWAQSACEAKAGVDPRAGLVDRTKCKRSPVNGHTTALHILEYHASKLRRNQAAHEMRTHEERELLYVMHGTVLITLRQRPPYTRVLYRRLLRPGDLAYYPGSLPHSPVAVGDADHATYLALRYLGTPSGGSAQSALRQFDGSTEMPRVWRARGESADEPLCDTSHGITTDVRVTRRATTAIPLGVASGTGPETTARHAVVGSSISSSPTRSSSSSSDLLLIVMEGEAIVDTTALTAPATLLLPAGSWSPAIVVHPTHRDANFSVVQIEFSSTSPCVSPSTSPPPADAVRTPAPKDRHIRCAKWCTDRGTVACKYKSGACAGCPQCTAATQKTPSLDAARGVARKRQLRYSSSSLHRTLPNDSGGGSSSSAGDGGGSSGSVSPEAVHLCPVAMGKPGAVSELELMLRSARATSRAPIALHVLASNHTAAAVKRLFQVTHAAWLFAESRQADHHELALIAAELLPGFELNAHHSGPWGFAKTWLHRFWPELDRCVMIDTDMLLLRDVSALWRLFDHFTTDTRA